MKRRRILLALMVLGLPAWLFADVVHLRHGATREGRIVSQTEEVIVLEVVTGNVRGRVTISRADVDHIDRRPTSHQTLAEEYARRLERLDRDDADAVIALVAWSRSNLLYAQAEGLLSDLAARDVKHFDRAMTELARMAYDRKLAEDASRYARAVLRHHPEHAEAKALLEQIARDEEKRHERLLREAIRAFNSGSYGTVLKRLERIRTGATPERMKALIADADLPTGGSLEAFAAEARLRQVERKGGRIGSVPDWQRGAVIALVKERIERSSTEFEGVAERLMTTVEADGAIEASIERAERAAASATRWITELEALESTSLAETREVLERLLRKAYVHAGGLLGQHALSTWQKVQAAGGSLLRQDDVIRGIRADARRAGELLLRARTRQDAVAGLRRLQTDIETVLAHNRKLMASYSRARKSLGGDRRTIHVMVDRKALNAEALRALQEIMDNASPADLDYLSGRLEHQFGRDLRELMEDCRRSPAEGGYADVYGEDEPVERLLAEADGHAWEACKTHRLMWRFKENGRADRFPIILIHRARNHAKDATRLYHQVLDGPYRISFTQRQEIFRQLELMADIISGTWEWYKKNGKNPRPERYR